MKKSNNNPQSGGRKQGNDPSKNDPTKQDERDNDATRIRPEKDNREKPATPPDPGGGGRNPGIEEPGTGAPYKRNPQHKPDVVEEPDRKQDGAINKGYNPASPRNRQNDTSERTDSGDAVM